MCENKFVVSAHCISLTGTALGVAAHVLRAVLCNTLLSACVPCLLFIISWRWVKDVIPPRSAPGLWQDGIAAGEAEPVLALSTAAAPCFGRRPADTVGNYTLRLPGEPISAGSRLPAPSPAPPDYLQQLWGFWISDGRTSMFLCSRPGWIKSWPTWSSERHPCPWQEWLWLDDLQGPLQSLMFYDSISWMCFKSFLGLNNYLRRSHRDLLWGWRA